MNCVHTKLISVWFVLPEVPSKPIETSFVGQLFIPPWGSNMQIFWVYTSADWGSGCHFVSSEWPPKGYNNFIWLLWGLYVKKKKNHNFHHFSMFFHWFFMPSTTYSIQIQWNLYNADSGRGRDNPPYSFQKSSYAQKHIVLRCRTVPQPFLT